MSNRFLSLGVTSELAREDTLVEIRDTINNGIELNASNLTQLNGNTINLGTGNTDTGTQRIVIASDQPAIPISGAVSGDVNITEVKGTTVSVDHGSSDAGTIRVTLPNDVVTTGWENVPTNIKAVNDTIIGGSSLPVNVVNFSFNTNLIQIDGASVSRDAGVSELGTQRVTLANDQNTSQWDNIRVQNINNRNNLSSVEFDRFSATNNGNNAVFIDAAGEVFVSNTNTPVISSSIFIPSGNTTAYIKSGSANDDEKGTGLQTVSVHYYSDDGTLQIRTVNLSGTTGSDITLGNADFFRMKDIFPLAVGTTNAMNAADIFINDTSTPASGNNYAGRFNRNRWHCSFIHFPVLSSGYSATTHLDSVIYNRWQNTDTTSSDVNVYIWSRVNISGTTFPWSLRSTFLFEGRHTFINVPLKNISFNSAITWVDIVWTMQAKGTELSWFSAKLDYHTE